MTILAMDYRQWLLATTALIHPDTVRMAAAPRALVRAAKAAEARAKALKEAAAS